MKSIVFALLVGCSHAAPPPASTAAPAPRACVESGDVLYQIDQNPASHGDEVDVRTKVFHGGAWTVSTRAGTRRGCLAAAQLDAIARALDRATWMRVVTNHQCTEAPPRRFYFVDGAMVHEQYGCAFHLDDATARAVAEIEQILAPVNP